eukprot:899332-Rhodomonas_salina.3
MLFTASVLKTEAQHAMSERLPNRSVLGRLTAEEIATVTWSQQASVSNAHITVRQYGLPFTSALTFQRWDHNGRTNSAWFNKRTSAPTWHAPGYLEIFVHCRRYQEDVMLTNQWKDPSKPSAMEHLSLSSAESVPGPESPALHHCGVCGVLTSLHRLGQQAARFSPAQDHHQSDATSKTKQHTSHLWAVLFGNASWMVSVIAASSSFPEKLCGVAEEAAVGRPHHLSL